MVMGPLRLGIVIVDDDVAQAEGAPDRASNVGEPGQETDIVTPGGIRKMRECE